MPQGEGTPVIDCALITSRSVVATTQKPNSAVTWLPIMAVKFLTSYQIGPGCYSAPGNAGVNGGSAELTTCGWRRSTSGMTVPGSVQVPDEASSRYRVRIFTRGSGGDKPPGLAVQILHLSAPDPASAPCAIARRPQPEPVCPSVPTLIVWLRCSWCRVK